MIIKNEKIDFIKIVNRLFLVIFILSTGILAFYLYLIKESPPTSIGYIGLTAFGLFFVLTLIKGYFLKLKDIDLDFFRNIMTGVSGGIAVWLLSSINFSALKTNFLVTFNEILVNLGLAVLVILIAYLICKKD